MGTRIKVRQSVDELALGVSSYEMQAREIFEDALNAAALIPPTEFEEVLNAAPEMEYHHRFVQSILTWVWYEVNENGVELDHLPHQLQGFYTAFEGPFAQYWM